MIPYPRIDPVALALGPFQVRWYGLMYVLGFLAAWLLGRLRARKAGSGWTASQVDDLLTFCAIGVIAGARLGYVLFYDLEAYLASPLDIFKLWMGGMSFHGGLAGVLIALSFAARRTGRAFWEVVDMAAPLVPPGLFFGRLGNFVNGELFGRPTESPLGMVFPAGGPLPRHPSQLYEACLEGLVLFVLLWWFSSRTSPIGAISAFFALGYGVSRISVEFFREPDAHLGFIAFGWLTTGQLLCLPLIVSGVCLLIYAYARPHAAKRKTAA
jgi:phosphatidylglycerol:prolipoprotein diacylglycerol transferase